MPASPSLTSKFKTDACCPPAPILAVFVCTSQVLSKDVRKWDVAYDLISDVARTALGKASTRLKDGEVTRVYNLDAHQSNVVVSRLFFVVRDEIIDGSEIGWPSFVFVQALGKNAYPTAAGYGQACC